MAFLILGEYKMCRFTEFVESLALLGQFRLSRPSPLQQCDDDDDDSVLQVDKNFGQSLKMSRFFILYCFVFFINQIVLLLCHVGY